jgi:hypothetical protein
MAAIPLYLEALPEREVVLHPEGENIDKEVYIEKLYGFMIHE